MAESEALVLAWAAYDLAIGSGDPQKLAAAAHELASLLAEHGGAAEARAIYQRAIDSGHTDIAAVAANDLGVLLERQGDTAGARAAYQFAIDSGRPNVASMAANNLGVLLVALGDRAGAREVYRFAMDTGDADHAPVAAFRLGLLLLGRGDLNGARAAYQVAIDSGHTEQAPVAAVQLGLLMVEQGDVDGARTAYQSAIDSGHADLAPAAANNLGVLLAEQGDVAGARAAYQIAIDSGHPEVAQGAMDNLASLLDDEPEIGILDLPETLAVLGIDTHPDDFQYDDQGRLIYPPQTESDSQFARGVRVVDGGFNDVDLVYVVAWLSGAAASGIVGNIAFEALHRLWGKAKAIHDSRESPEPPGFIDGSVGAKVVARLAVQARCGELGMNVPQTSSLKIDTVRTDADRPRIWHVIVHGKDLRAEVVVAEGITYEQVIPVSIWTVSEAGSHGAAEHHRDRQ